MADVTLETAAAPATASTIAQARGPRVAPMRILIYLAVAVILIVQFFPLVWSLLTSLMTPAETTAIPATLAPGHPTLSSYQQALQGNIGHYYVNSIVVATVSTLITMILAMLAGYAFARLNFRFKTQILLVVLALSLFPPLAQVLPIYRAYTLANQMFQVKLIGSLTGLIIPYSILGLPLAVLILIAFFQEIPNDLEEAAMVDGMTRFQAFLRVILPLTAPGFFTTAIIVFVGNWNEYLYALIFTNPTSYTLPVGIVTISQTEFTTNFGILSAATVLAVVPLVALILLLERRIVSGLTAGAVKG